MLSPFASRATRAAVGWLALVACGAGCDQVFGLHDPPDAASSSDDSMAADARSASCPPIGMAPKFASVLHQVGTKFCWDYTISRPAGIGIASCDDGFRIDEGALDGELVPAGFGAGIDHPRLFPEGDEVIARHYVTGVPTYARYRKVGTTWTDQGTTSFGVTALFVSTPTRGPGRRIMVVDTSYVMHELVENAAVWTERATYSSATLGVRPGPVMMTPDGLRLVISPQLGDPDYLIWYADRGDVGQPFGPVTALTTVTPSLFAPYLTEDCGRLYFTLGQQTDVNKGLFYVEQL